ncbi:MAG: hypothetical protein JRJ86_00380 [Deltaproteobacteria bacterium]|nr:hypothetical protein [Deltaproteobacteria bacterium]MBW2117642.1 hypothetical protein [Deltaproteobacteria bacterium]MBW2342764.1 hypothetical protein [Deltaproteobacteria bacterium]
MPTYEYKCKQCGLHFERIFKIKMVIYYNSLN